MMGYVSGRRTLQEIEFRTIQARFGRDQTHGPCNQPIGFSLQHHQLLWPQRERVYNSQGSSCSRFSKNLLPYWSLPIKVPALVSPSLRQHANTALLKLEESTNVLYPCEMFGQRSPRRTPRLTWGCDRTAIWWAKSCLC